MSEYPNKQTVDAIRSKYPVGIRVELVSMNDPFTNLRPGDQGTVEYVDDIGTVFVNWDNGSGLGVAYGADHVRIIPPAGFVCHRCKAPVYKSDNPEYSFQCFSCDEDLYSMEVDPAPEVKP